MGNVRVGFAASFVLGFLMAVSPRGLAHEVTPTGSLAARRFAHTATLLGNGKVLVAGGLDQGTLLTSAELYDPTTGTWSSTGTLAAGRAHHTATLLPNGKVLVAGTLFTGTATLSCLKAGDANDSGVLDLSDGVYLLAYLFLGGPAPPAPFPDCGTDPTDDELDCASYEGCP